MLFPRKALWIFVGGEKKNLHILVALTNLWKKKKIELSKYMGNSYIWGKKHEAQWQDAESLKQNTQLTS